MKVQIKVTYKSKAKISKKLDKHLKNVMDHIGAEWYAQGVDTNSGERDICFDYEIEGL